jgi:hypothetical protein
MQPRPSCKSEGVRSPGALQTDGAAIVADFCSVDRELDRLDLAWKYPLNPDVLDPMRRTFESRNWLRTESEQSLNGGERALNNAIFHLRPGFPLLCGVSLSSDRRSSVA